MVAVILFSVKVVEFSEAVEHRLLAAVGHILTGDEVGFV